MGESNEFKFYTFEKSSSKIEIMNKILNNENKQVNYKNIVYNFNFLIFKILLRIMDAAILI